MNKKTDFNSIFLYSIFQGQYFEIDPVWDFEYLLDMLEEYIDKNNPSSLLGYGFSPEIFDWYPNENDRIQRLDMISKEISIILISEDEKTYCGNTLGISHIKNNDILELANFDKDMIFTRAMEKSKLWLEKGFESVFIQDTPFFIKNVFSEVIGEREPLNIEFINLKERTFEEIETGDGVFIENPSYETLIKKFSAAIDSNLNILVRSYNKSASMTALKALKQVSDHVEGDYTLILLTDSLRDEDVIHNTNQSRNNSIIISSLPTK